MNINKLAILFTLPILACVSQTAIVRHELVNNTSPVYYVCRTESGLNVRSAPGFGNPITSTLPEGTLVNFTGHTAVPVAVEWWQIEGGWVSSKYVCER